MGGGGFLRRGRQRRFSFVLLMWRFKGAGGKLGRCEVQPSLRTNLWFLSFSLDSASAKPAHANIFYVKAIQKEAEKIPHFLIWEPKVYSKICQKSLGFKEDFLKKKLSNLNH